MERYNLIIQHRLFKEASNQNEYTEKDRMYCRHDFQHQIDVARIGYIKILENNLPILKDVMYASALLHDIGRHMEYQYSVKHEDASADIAESILSECEYSISEIEEIIDAIKSHRSPVSGEPKSLKDILFVADKASRMCGRCNVADSCKWPDEKKNLFICC